MVLSAARRSKTMIFQQCYMQSKRIIGIRCLLVRCHHENKCMALIPSSYVDDLPVRSPVGMVTEDTLPGDDNHVEHDPRWSHTYLYTHKNFAIEYNDDRVYKDKEKVVVIVNVSHDPLDHSCQIGIWQSC